MAPRKRVCSPELLGVTARLRESPADIETGHKLQKGAGDRIKAKLVLQGNSDRSSRVKEYSLFCSFSFCHLYLVSFSNIFESKFDKTLIYIKDE